MVFLVSVPDVPGVPPVNFAPGSNALLPVLLTADTPGLYQGFANPAWGIFLNGAPIVTAQQVTSMEFIQEYTESDFPLEQGAFETYDKVQVPFNVRFRFASGGAEADRTALLSSIQGIVGDLNFYDAVSPTAVYTSCNIIHQDYRRTATNGAGLITIDVWLREVRVAASGSTTSASSAPSSTASQAPYVNAAGQVVTPSQPTYTNAAGQTVFTSPSQPDAAAPVNGGTVQPTTPTPTQVDDLTVINAG